MVEAVPLSWVLIVAAALFCIGLFGAIAGQKPFGTLLGILLMFSAVTINLVAFWRYLEPNLVAGQVFGLLVIAISALELLIALALVVVSVRGSSGAEES